VAAPKALHFTTDDEANRLIASDPFALLVGFVLDQQVTVPTAFAGPLKIKRRLGTLEPARLARTDLEPVFREKPAVHRFPGSMAQRVQDLARHVEEEYGGDASRLWKEAKDADDLKRRLEALPGFGELKVKSVAAVLAKRYGVKKAEPLVPAHPTLGDVDSIEALQRYQEQKRAHKASMRARS
jgi:uncharacterized HhH-GPD family protein